MKFVLPFSVFLIATLVCCADVDFRKISFTTGPRAFHAGDEIDVVEVYADGDDFEVGDTVIVRGRYRLKSREAANMLLTVTQTSGDGKTQLAPGQKIRVERGSGPFELRIKIPAEGYLHLGFYPTNGGSGVGSLYIGTRQKMNAIEDWDLEARLEDND